MSNPADPAQDSHKPGNTNNRDNGAWIGVAISAFLFAFGAWITGQSLSWALSASEPWLIALAWIGAALGFCEALFFLGLIIAIIVGGNLLTKPGTQPRATGKD